MIAPVISECEASAPHAKISTGLEGKLVLCPELPSRRDRVLP
jgi:hypothetical protein